MQSIQPSQNLRVSLLVMGLLVVLVTGYWSFGKSFGYLGIHPFYIGEAVLLAGLGMIAYRGRYYVLKHASFWLYWLFFGLALVQGGVSVFLLKQSAMEVIRNLAIVYYGLFAYVVYALTAYPGMGRTFYQNLVRSVIPRLFPYLLGGSLLTLWAFNFLDGQLPLIPGTQVPIVFYKPTDAVMPFFLYFTLAIRGHLPQLYLLGAMLPILICSARSRSVMICFFVASLLTLRPSRRYVKLFGVLAALLVLLAVSGLRLNLGYREVSAAQFVANSLSILNLDEQSAQVDPTTSRNKRWRAEWWDQIVADSVGRERVVMGLGWGTNLAEAFEVMAPGAESDLNALRHPHNAFFGILARGGWLAAGLWACFYASLFWGLWRAKQIFGHVDRELGDFAVAIMVYVAASLVNGSTDVFLESPQVAIPHWIVIGLGWGLIRLARQQAGLARQRHLEEEASS